MNRLVMSVAASVIFSVSLQRERVHRRPKTLWEPGPLYQRLSNRAT